MPEPTRASVGSYRWRICALLFFATTINYIDRQVLGILAPELEKSIGWNEAQYGYIVTSFQAAYAIFCYWAEAPLSVQRFVKHRPTG